MTEATWGELLGEESALVLRLGQLVFVWAKNTSIVKVVRVEKVDEDKLTRPNTALEVIIEVEVPPGLRQEPGPFTNFCREFVGADTAFFVTVADVKLLTGDLSDYDDNADRAMEGMLALDTRMREWLKAETKTPDARPEVPDIDAINEGDVAARDRVLRETEKKQ